jgi:hypothetical protein
MKQKCIGELHNYLGGVWEKIFSFYKMNGGQEGGGMFKKCVLMKCPTIWAGGWDFLF